MKTFKKLLNLLFLSILIFACEENRTENENDVFIELPIARNLSEGSFSSGLSGNRAYSPKEDSLSDSWQNLHLDLKGIPENWNWVKVGDITTDLNQRVYQAYY